PRSSGNTQITGSLGLNTQIIVKAPTGPLPPAPRGGPAAATSAPMHHITLKFLDPDGKVVTDFREMKITPPNFPSPAARTQFGRSSYADTDGLHYFMPGDQLRWDLEIAEGFYKAVHETIALDGSLRQTIAFHLQRGLPVQGRILDAQGKPAANVALSIY